MPGAIPDESEQILDGALGVAPDNIDGVHVKLGIASGGVANTLYSFSRPQDVVATLVSGPLVESLCYSLVVAGGPVYAMPLTSSVAGTNSAVSQVGSGPVVTLTGAPVDQYDGIAKIVLGGAVGTATFQYSLDGGDNYSDLITTAATYLIPGTGVTLNFAAGTYVAATTYSFTSTAPYFNSTNLNTGFTALLALPAEWSFAHVVGRGTAAADSASMIAAVQTHMAAAATNHRFVSTVLELADDTDANLIAALTAISADRVVPVGGFAEMYSSVSGRQYKRHAGTPLAARGAYVAQKSPSGIATDLGRVKDKSVPSIISLYRDERVLQTFTPARISSLRTIIGKQGFWITEGRTLAPTGSDYKLWQNRRVMDKVCRFARSAILEYLNDDVRTNANGTIYELDARNIEAWALAILDENIVRTKNATRVACAVDRTINVTSTSRMQVDVRVRPKGYLKDITVVLGFEVPNVVPLAA